MRKTIIFGTLAALFGFAALAQASDRSRVNMGGDAQVTRAASNDSQGDRHERDTSADRSGERHDDSGERHDAREGHHEDDAAEHRDRR
jgi:hypothetical protein